MTKPLHCSFCGKSQYEVDYLIAGPEVFICNECVTLCHDIILAKNKEPATANYPCGSLGEEIHA